MGKRSGGTRGTNSSNSSKSRKSTNGGVSDMELARKEYDQYIHGEGYFSDNGKFSHVDLLAKPTTENIQLYRGSTNEELDAIMNKLGISGDNYRKLEGKSYNDKYLKSTSSNKRDADNYASDVYDLNEMREENDMPLLRPVVFHYNVGKGTKVISRKGQGFETSGRGAMCEHTLPHGTKYTIRSVSEERDYLGVSKINVYVDVGESTNTSRPHTGRRGRRSSY